MWRTIQALTRYKSQSPAKPDSNIKLPDYSFGWTECVSAHQRLSTSFYQPHQFDHPSQRVRFRRTIILLLSFYYHLLRWWLGSHRHVWPHIFSAWEAMDGRGLLSLSQDHCCILAVLHPYHQVCFMTNARIKRLAFSLTHLCAHAHTHTVLSFRCCFILSVFYCRCSS